MHKKLWVTATLVISFLSIATPALAQHTSHHARSNSHWTISNSQSVALVTAINTNGTVNVSAAATAPVQLLAKRSKPIIVSFRANPTHITVGQSAVLSWSVSGATSIRLDPSIGLVTGSSRTVSPTATTTYTLSAVNTFGTTTAQVTLGVVPVPVIPPPSPSGETKLTAYTTAYASGDNDPAGSTITYINGIEGNAGGTGTYADPITLAVGYVGNVADIAPGTMFYVPNVERYFKVADTCAACHKTPSGVQIWVDMYAGDYSGSGVLACEDTITGNFTIIKNPANNYKVTPGTLYSGTTCTPQFGNAVLTQ